VPVGRLRFSPTVRVGFVPLIDAAPLIVGVEMGFFDQVGLRVELHRQIGWGNIRDRLLFGQLDAAHALMGLAVSSALARPDAAPAIVNVMSLGTGGDAITLSRRLFDQGVTTAATLAKHLRNGHRNDPPTFGHVFDCSVHHYLLREWLARGQVNPDEDVRLSVFPPILAASHMARGHLDGFCVGEPWNLIAQRERSGQIVALTTDILESHPDKMLAVRRSMLDDDPATVFRLILALIRAGEYCADPANHPTLARLLAMPGYLDVDADTLAASLSLDRQFNLRPSVQHFRKPGWHMRSFSTASMFPNVGFGVWLIEQMMRWNHVGPDVDPVEVATTATHTASFREAAATLGAECPPLDLMPVGHADQTAIFSGAR
jgi:two-component system, oxyanion-binding sensor